MNTNWAVFFTGRTTASNGKTFAEISVNSRTGWVGADCLGTDMSNAIYNPPVSWKSMVSKPNDKITGEIKPLPPTAPKLNSISGNVPSTTDLVLKGNVDFQKYKVLLNLWCKTCEKFELNQEHVGSGKDAAMIDKKHLANHAGHTMSARLFHQNNVGTKEGNSIAFKIALPLNPTPPKKPTAPKLSEISAEVPFSFDLPLKGNADFQYEVLLNCYCDTCKKSIFENESVGGFGKITSGNVAFVPKSKLQSHKGHTIGARLLHRNNGVTTEGNPIKFKISPVPPALNVEKAVAYARDNTDNSGEKPGRYNSKEYNKYAADCTNFVSQCLYAGGLPETQGWKRVTKGQGYKGDPGKTTWVSAPNLYQYLQERGYQSEKVCDNLSNIHKGDVVFMVFGKGKEAEHATICTGTNPSGTPFYCAHSYWRLDEPYDKTSWKIAYVVHLSI